MIYLSAQPARFYFVWQLKIQLYNFSRLGIKKHQIHVLFGHRSASPIDQRVIEFVKHCKLANFYFYEDTRPPSYYEPTIRPHIIKKHINQNPYLENEAIFYHDCDIIFREVPNFKKMLSDNKWYMSNAESYIGASCLSELNLNVFHKMAEIVGINKEVITNLPRSGGAQSLVKNTNYAFWDKIESDSNSLFNYLKTEYKLYVDRYHEEFGGEKGSKINYIQPWCADMWAILWNGLLFNNEVVIHEELDFCWATDNSSRWLETKIMHNAGVTFSDSYCYFYKGSFINKSPFNTKLDYVKQDTCSRKYIDEMEMYLRNDKFDLKDASFLIIVRIDSPERLINLTTVIGYLNKHFKTNVFVLEADLDQKIDPNSFDMDVIYEFVRDNNPAFNRGKYNNLLLNKCKTKVAIIQDTDVIIDTEQLIKAVELTRKGQCDMICPYDGVFVEISDKKVRKEFTESYDIKTLMNDTKAFRAPYIPLGGCVVVNRIWYKSKGFENRLINGYGPDDIERVVRTIITGGCFERLKGDLFHLSHPRLENSYYSVDFDTRFGQLLEIVNMDKSTLSGYISERLL